MSVDSLSSSLFSVWQKVAEDSPRVGKWSSFSPFLSRKQKRGERSSENQSFTRRQDERTTTGVTAHLPSIQDIRKRCESLDVLPGKQLSTLFTYHFHQPHSSPKKLHKYNNNAAGAKPTQNFFFSNFHFFFLQQQSQQSSYRNSK